MTETLIDGLTCFHCKFNYRPVGTYGSYAKFSSTVGPEGRIGPCICEGDTASIRKSFLQEINEVSTLPSDEWWTFAIRGKKPNEIVPLVRKSCLPVLRLLLEFLNLTSYESLQVVQYSLPLWAVGNKPLINVPLDDFPLSRDALMSNDSFDLMTFVYFQSAFILWADESLLTETRRLNARFNASYDEIWIDPVTVGSGDPILEPQMVIPINSMK
jgi:hypothetical protein